MEQNEREARRIIRGVVISTKNAKTITVSVETHKVHPKYGKRIKYRKKYYAHDEKCEAQVGDSVTIMATRKLSALKRWRLVSIDKVHLEAVKDAEKELEVEEGIISEVTPETPVVEEAKAEETKPAETSSENKEAK